MSVTIQLSDEAALELYRWLESDAAPDYWNTTGLSQLQAALSAWHRYESPIGDPSPVAPEVTYDRKVLVEILVYHYRSDIKGCGCGWAVLGASWPEHVADVYEQSIAART